MMKLILYVPPTATSHIDQINQNRDTQHYELYLKIQAFCLWTAAWQRWHHHMAVQTSRIAPKLPEMTSEMSRIARNDGFEIISAVMTRMPQEWFLCSCAVQVFHFGHIQHDCTNQMQQISYYSCSASLIACASTDTRWQILVPWFGSHFIDIPTSRLGWAVRSG